MKKNGILFRAASGLLTAAPTLRRFFHEQIPPIPAQPTCVLLSFSLCCTDVHRDREQLL